jgi:hypothetical protein
LALATARSWSAWSAAWSPRRACSSCSTPPAASTTGSSSSWPAPTTAKPGALDLDHPGATEQGVRFLGMRDDVDRLYGAMDLFVLPSWREGSACGHGEPPPACR